jgi:hypothetical protein
LLQGFCGGFPGALTMLIGRKIEMTERDSWQKGESMLIVLEPGLDEASPDPASDSA